MPPEKNFASGFASVRGSVVYWLQMRYEGNFPVFEPEISTKSPAEYFAWLVSEIAQGIVDRPRSHEVTALLIGGKDPMEIVAMLARDSLEELKKARRSTRTRKAPLEKEMMVTASQEQLDEAGIGAKILIDVLGEMNRERT